MHVLLLTTSFPSQAYPASGIFIQRMLERLPQGILVTVLTPGSDRCESALSTDRIKIIRLPYAPRSWQTLAHKPGGMPAALKSEPAKWCLIPLLMKSISLATFLHASNVDLIHANWSACGLVAGLVGRICNKPVITTLRGSDVLWADASPVFRHTVKWCGILSSQLATQSHAMADQVGRWFPQVRNKIRVIPNGVGGQFVPNQANEGQGFTVGVVGNLIRLKNVDVVVRALGALMVKKPDVKLIIVGDGPERQRLQGLVQRHGLERQITFTGMLAPHLVPQQLAKCHMLASASSSEGRPNAVLEAMAAGVPVVASDIDGVREMIGNNERGLLFPVGDAHRLAACLQHLMDNPSLGTQLAACAKQWLHDQQLTWDYTALQYADVYQKVLSEYQQRNS